MYSSTFTFAKKQYDDDFLQLDQAIADIARQIPGYLGEEAWEGAGLISNVYYWDSLESLQALVQHPRHLEAKARYSEWLDGYQVVIAQVIKVYGNGGLTGLPLSGVAQPLERP